MFAYDIVKIKPYKLSNNESLNGLPHEVLFNEYISCRGYCNLLIEILDGEDIKIVNQNLDIFDKNQNKIDHHARCTVLLDDDKYNIHGLFNSLSKDKILQYINTNYINFDLMLKIITNIKKAMGYSNKQISIEIDRISKIRLEAINE